MHLDTIDYTYTFQATAENIVEPQVEPTDFTNLKAEVETAKALKAGRLHCCNMEIFCR